MNENSKIAKLIKKVKAIKHIEIIIAVVAIGIMLVLYFSSKIIVSNPDTNDSTAKANYCEEIEKKLTKTLSGVKGAGAVTVIINWESSIESIIAYITNNSSNSSSQTPQLIPGDGKPIILKELYPSPIGVIITCQGGDSVKVRLDLMNAVSNFLGITPEKVNVLTMKK